MNPSILKQEGIAHQGSGGVISEHRSFGFRPAFRNTETGRVYAARFADSRLAPVHMIDGLPDEVVVARSVSGKALSLTSSVQSGFTRNGRFYDHDQAAAYLARRLADSCRRAWT